MQSDSVNKEELEKLKTNFKDIDKEQNEIIEINDSKVHDGVYLFISYDLVNSTSLKSKNKKEWLDINRKFYNLIQSELANKIKVSTWRYLGDEIIFYKKIFDSSELFEYTYKAIDELNKQYAEFKNFLFIKSCIWIANVQYSSENITRKLEDHNAENIISYFENNTLVDFLGIDIDTGFRIKGYSHKNIMVISAELAYILNEYAEDSLNELLKNNLRIVSYEKLKGVWNNRYYPIIWYYNDWENIEQCFYYDDKFENPLVKKAMETSEGISRIKAIFDDLNKNIKINEIIETIKQSNKQPEEYSLDLTRLAEVHCVAVCFNNKGEILIIKRSKNEPLLKNIWEFGCCQLRNIETFEDCMMRTYKDDFNLELEFKFDNENNIMPIKQYKVPLSNSSKHIPGLIYIAKVKNEDQIKIKKHQAYKWINPTDFIKKSQEQYVPNIEDTINKALKAYKEWTKDEK